MNADNSSVTNTGQFIIALDIAAFMDVDTFKRQIDDVIRLMRSSPTLAGVDRVRMPGEGSHAAIADRVAHGIPLSAPLLDGLRNVADELHVAPLD